MKKFFYSMLTLAAAFTFISCEDVPEPYDLPGIDEGNGTTIIEATGTGTADDPYNVVAALKICEKLEKSSTSASYLSDEVYVKGKIVSIVDTELSSYGNITYYISDDGSAATQLEVYRGMSFNGAKFTALSDIKAGDEVVLVGKLQNWLGTYEFTQGAKLVSLNGSTGNGGGDNPTPDLGTPAGSGTEADPYNVAAAIGVAVEAGETATTEAYYVKGIVSKTASYPNTFFISDDGKNANEFEFYNGLGIDGATLVVGDVEVGDKVVIYGNIVNYMGNTPEMTKGCQLISIEKGAGNTGAGGGVEDDEKTIVFNAGVEKGSISDYNNAGADSMTKNGITISITKGCLGMSAHYRTYKNESMTVASSVGNIASIEFTCTAEGNAQYGPGCWTATDGSYTYEGVVGTWTGDAASVSFTASTAQVRATKIVVRLK